MTRTECKDSEKLVCLKVIKSEMRDYRYVW